MRKLLAKLGGWAWDHLGLEPIGEGNEPPVVQSPGGCCAEGSTCPCAGPKPDMVGTGKLNGLAPDA